MENMGSFDFEQFTSEYLSLSFILFEGGVGVGKLNSETVTKLTHLKIPLFPRKKQN